MLRTAIQCTVLAWLCLGNVLLAPFSSLAAQAPVEAFGRLPFHDYMEISPDGRYLAGLKELNGRRIVVIYNLFNLDAEPYALDTQDASATWLHWANSNRLLISIRFAGGRFGVRLVETRLIAVNADGSNMQSMIKQKRGERKLQIKDDVVSFLKSDPSAILMAYNERDPSEPKVFRVDINSGEGKLVQGRREHVTGWMADQQGKVRIAFGFETGQKNIFDEGFEFIDARAPGSTEWQRLWQADQLSASVFTPLFFKSDGNTLYVRSNHEGGTSGVYEYNLTRQQFTELVYKRDDVDAGGLILDSARTRVIGIRYVSDGMRIHWLDPDADRLDRSLEAALGVGATVVSRSRSGAKSIVRAGSASEGGKYYVYDNVKKTLHFITSRYPELERIELSDPVAVSYLARDGLTINGFLTLPPSVDLESTKPLRTVIFPHGGPTARDTLSFDYMAQFLANRGYAVFQMNFRGSSGYGTAFQQAGYGQWGKAMQDDITDGTRWLIKRGVADADRICIFGSSYGGYAALMGPVREPDLYACAVSLNGATDLRALMRSARAFVNGEYAFAHVGDYSDDSAELRAYSPVTRAGEITVPVLLVHGTEDRVVPFSQSQRMASALDRKGKQYKLVKLEDGDHYLSSGTHRLNFLRELESFLAANLQ